MQSTLIRFLHQFFQTLLCHVLVYAFFCLPALQANATSSKHVLFLSSYSLNWPTVPQQISGVQSVLSAEADIDFEFMDTKKIPYLENKSHHYASIKKLLDESKKYDAIIVADDAALQLVIDYHDKLFSNAPVIFQGVNDRDRAKRAVKFKNVFGIIEKDTYEKNIEYAKKLFPGTKNVVAIIDDSLTGEGQKKLFFEYAKKFPELNFSILDLSSLSYRNFIERLKQLSPNSVPFLFVAGHDVKDNNYTDKDIVSAINAYSPVPVMTMYHNDSTISYGLLGGSVVDHFESGRLCGKIAQKIFQGASYDEIPNIVESPDVDIFNYQIIKRININEGALPQDVVFINRDEPFYKKHAQVIQIGLSIFLAIICIALIFLFKIRSRLIKNITQRNRELVEISNEASQASKAKTMFLSRVSHEIRTPMNAIIGLSNIVLEDQRLHADLKEKMEKIMQSSKQLLDLVNDILDTSVIEQKKLKIAFKPFSLNELIQTVYELNLVLFNKHNISFSLSNTITSPLVKGDVLRVRQILYNLLSNALKFTAPGGQVSLSCVQRKCTEQTVFVDFIVSDNGCGIDPNMMSRLFLPFEQENASTDNQYGGSGLGLSICKRLTEMMNGVITAQSEKNKGSTFIVSIPFMRDIDHDKESTVCVKPIDGHIDLSDKRILLVEDNEINREVVIELFKHTHITIDVATDGQQALSIFLKMPPRTYSLILMDIQMPVMNGCEATKQIRSSSHEQAKTIPIIAMSANSSSKDIAMSLQCGMNDHIAKPFNFQVLLKQVIRYSSMNPSDTSKA